MSVKPTEIFVVTLKKASPKKKKFVRIFQSQLEINFFKISIFFTFPDI